MNKEAFEIPIERVPSEHSVAIVTICAIFLGLAWLAVGLRLWTRARIVRSVGWDDGTMLITTIFFTVLCASTSTLTILVGDRTAVSESLITTSIYLLLVSEIFYVLSMMVLKVSLALFFLRIIVEKWQRRTIYAVIFIFSLFSSGYFFYAIFQCGVPHGDSIWVRKLVGECAGKPSILGLGYSHALVNALTDLTFVCLSLSMVRKVQINIREKIIVAGIFFLASVGCIASFVRLPWIKSLAVTDTTFFNKLLFLAICSTIEPGLGIVAASMATLRPLLRKIESQLYSLKSLSSNTSSQSDTGFFPGPCNNPIEAQKEMRHEMLASRSEMSTENSP